MQLQVNASKEWKNFEFMIGSITGVLWGIIITSLKNNSIMYIGNSGVEVCSRPSQTYFSCKVVPKSVA